MNRPRAHYVTLGSPVPVVPASHFSSLPLTAEMEAALWQIVGPSAARNLQNFQLWQVIVAAYAEGLDHGASLERRRIEEEKS